MSHKLFYYLLCDCFQFGTIINKLYSTKKLDFFLKSIMFLRNLFKQSQNLLNLSSNKTLVNGFSSKYYVSFDCGTCSKKT